MRRSHVYLFFFPLLLIVFALTGCGDLSYFSKMGWNQGAMRYYSVPVEDTLERNGLNAEGKEKIRFIQEVKEFGEKRLGLKPTKNYSTFLEVKGPLLHVISACEKDRLHSYSWKFPLVGRVDYKGFFDARDADRERASLDKQGYDTYAQNASAYSTLGWFKDPILSSMLKWDHASLANLILHEITHSTIYIKGETAFNEQVATFVGNRGSILFLTEKYGPDSEEVTAAKGALHDDLLFSRWLDHACRRLEEYYDLVIPKEEKVKGREKVFVSLKEELKSLRSEFKTDSYSFVEKMELNNAVLLSLQRYTHRSGDFEDAFERVGKDMSRFISALKMIQSSGKAFSLPREGGIPISSLFQK
jgi:predicted aminopeptidase